MTAQINDTVFHRKIRFSLAGIAGAGLVVPSVFGFQPAFMSTACWRGYVAHYTVTEEQLVLTSLDVGLPQKEALLAKTGRGPTLFGAQPITNEHGFGFHYQDIAHRVPFTGGLLLAEGFIRQLYVHMGFHPAWKYQQVRELVFEQGHLLQDDDRSAQMAEVRDRMTEQAKGSAGRFSMRSQEEITQWVQKCFSRDYTMKV